MSIFSISLPSAERAGVVTASLLLAASLLTHPQILTAFLSTCSQWELTLICADTRNSNYSWRLLPSSWWPDHSSRQSWFQPGFAASITQTSALGMWACWFYMLKSAGSLHSTHQICGSPAAEICNHNPHGLQRRYETVLEKLKIKSELVKEVLHFCQHVYMRGFCRCGTRPWHT